LLAPRASGAGAAVLAVLDSAAAAAIVGLFTLGVLLFPDGRGHGRLGRALVPIACICLGLLLLGGAGAADAGGRSPFGTAFDGIATAAVLGGLALAVPITVLAAVTATLRRRDAEGTTRRGLALLESVAWINAAAFVVCGA